MPLSSYGKEESIVTPVGVPGEAGLNVASSPKTPSITVHCVVVGQAMPVSKGGAPPETSAGVGVPGDAGSKVSSSPVVSIPVHWPADGHARPRNDVPGSTTKDVRPAGEPGSKVASRP